MMFDAKRATKFIWTNNLSNGRQKSNEGLKTKKKENVQDFPKSLIIPDIG